MGKPRVVASHANDQKPLPLGPTARMNARVVFALVLAALALWTTSSFLPPLIWATILAVALWPLYLKFAERFMSGPTTAAAFVFTHIRPDRIVRWSGHQGGLSGNVARVDIPVRATGVN